MILAPPTDSDDGVPLYEARRNIYPQSVRGYFRNIKWIILIVTLSIYYFLPFVRWNRGPNAPDQAVLVDFPNQRFYFFFIEIWPQEVYFLTGLLVLAALILFLMNAVAGRIWCGYLCPQTVWTDLFYAVERFFEGDRREHMLRDKAGLTAQNLVRKGLKHLTWLMIAWWTGGAWVLYFADAPTLVKQLATFQAPLLAWIWIGILTFTTYALAGHMREQVCVYMCPWPRIQAALTDEHALNVTYRYDRGEPRGSVKKAEALRLEGQTAGDCIDCFQCVHVCPTGVDIRNGLQLDCIQCGLCIDACDRVMEKINRPTGLIAYDTDLNVKRRMEGLPEIRQIFRPRTLLYIGLIALVGAIMAFALGTRSTLGISLIHDRNPQFVRLSDGAIRNAYTMRILNKTREPRTFVLSVDGLKNPQIEVIGSPQEVTVGPDQTRELRLLITARPSDTPDSTLPIKVGIRDRDNGQTASTSDFFKGP